jgi:hypothetical membrane protein
MAVVQLAWTTPYSLQVNAISDLGAVHCATTSYGGFTYYVCSPLHTVFNVSIIVFGLCLVVGAILSSAAFPRRRLSAVGLAFLVLSGIGAIGVGLAPEDVNGNIHGISGILAFLGENVGLILLGGAVARDPSWRGYAPFSVAMGLVGLAALVLEIIGLWGPVGPGGMERLVVAPGLLWLVVVGARILRAPSEFRPRATTAPAVPA